MKANKLKSLGKNLALLGLSTVLFVSCGDDNKTNSANNLNDDNFVNGTGNLPSGVSNKVNEVKSFYSCPNGSRLQDIFLSVTSGTLTNTSVSGQFQQGHVSGTASTTFAGVMPQTLDLVFATKVAQGNSVAYNFVISFCSDSGQFGSGVFDQNTNFGNFQMTMPFNLDADVSCSIGNIDRGEIAFSYNNGYVNSSSLISVSKVCFQ